MNKHLKRSVVLVALGAIALAAACTFGDILGVADLTDRRIVGLLAANDGVDGERDRVYVGQHTLGTPWNPVGAKVLAINASNGVKVGETILPAGTAELRAVAADPGGTYVWTLHDDGTINAWPKDLGGPIFARVAFFRPPTGMTSVQLCDLEILPGGQLLATGVARQNGKVYGYLHHQAPHPTWTGGFYPGWLSWETKVLAGEGTELGRYCPRVAYDDSTQEVVMLKRSYAFSKGRDEIERLESYVFSGTYWGLTHVGGFSLAPEVKMRPVDVTTGYNHVFLLREYFDPGFGTPGGRVDIHHTDTGVDEDSIWIEEARAVHWADFLVDATHPSLLWWAGHDDVSKKELGTLSTVNDE